MTFTKVCLTCVSWNDCIGQPHFLIINTCNKNKAMKIFEKWCKDQEFEPVCFDMKKIYMTDFVYLTKN